jgi:hypothetical protein
VSVLLGNGDGTFQSAVDYGAGDEPCSIAIGDLDGDDDVDLAVANSWSDTVSVFLGNGDGTFQSAVDYGAGEGPESIAIGDLDGDDDLDLAVANSWSDTVSVFLGNGDGTFQSAVDYGAGDEPFSIAIGDLDGDDDLDLAVANSWSETVSVFINSRYRIETVYPKGWSMISLPVDPPDKRCNKLFPDAVVVYGYEKGTGYVLVGNDEDLEVGRGYWILLDQERSYTLTGHPIPSYTYPVSSDGWAMIGGCSSSAQVSSNNCSIGVIYRYVQGAGYQWVLPSEYLEPGKGYWILLKNVTGPASFGVQGTTE